MSGLAYGNIRIIESAHMTERKQTFVPRTKKKRIQEKARRNLRNWSDVPQTSYIQYGGTIICHPVVAVRIRYAIKQLQGVTHGNSSISHAERSEGLASQDITATLQHAGR